MPTTITGVDTNFDPTAGDANTTNAPADADGLNAASVNDAFQDVLDAICLFQRRINWPDMGDVAPVSTSDETAALHVKMTPTDRKQALWLDTDNGTASARVYYSATGEMEFIVGAVWDDGTQTWLYDNAATATKVVITEGYNLLMYGYGGVDGWADGAWVVAGSWSSVSGDLYATGSLQSGTAKSDTTAPTPTISVGDVWKDSAPLAWGWFHLTGGPPVNTCTFDRGYNIQSVTFNAAGQYNVSLKTAATNAVCVVATAVGSAFTVLTVDNYAAGSFRIYAWDAAGVATDADEVYFVVFGG